VIVQFLRGSYQLSAEEIIQRKQEFRWDKHGLVLSVMHPIHCVEEKLGLVCRMDQSGRQDLRHLKMALYFVPLFITDALLNGGTEASLGMCQRILKLAKFIGRARRTPAPSLDPFERNDSASIIVFTRAVTHYAFVFVWCCDLSPRMCSRRSDKLRPTASSRAFSTSTLSVLAGWRGRVCRDTSSSQHDRVG
jgi:hypothetical protein